MNYNDFISVNDVTNGTPTEPVTVAELKNYMRLEGFSDPSNIVAQSPINLTLLVTTATVTDSRLINAVILTLAREGIVFTQGLVVANRVFTFDSTTGTITFQNVADPSNESIDVTYGTSNGSGAFNFTGDDTLLADLITAARQMIEEIAGISLVSKTLDAELNYTSQCSKIEIPGGPNVVITTVKDRLANVIDATSYHVDGNFWVCFSSSYLYGLYIIRYTAGYVTVPKSIKIDIMRLATYLYENRGEDANINAFAFQLASKYIRQIVA